MSGTPLPPDTRQAIAGLTALLLETDLTVEQRHYARALARLAAEPAPETHEGEETPGDLLDRAVLAELYRYLPPAGCAAIVEQFRISAAQLLDEIDIALAAENAEALGHAAHSLIGTVGAVGMMPLAAEARAIMTDIRSGRSAAALARAPGLRPLYARSLQHLDGLLTEFEHNRR